MSECWNFLAFAKQLCLFERAYDEVEADGATAGSRNFRAGQVGATDLRLSRERKSPQATVTTRIMTKNKGCATRNLSRGVARGVVGRIQQNRGYSRL